MKLLDLSSGTIDLVQEKGNLYLQFNCECVDALPYCKAQCCRGRPTYNATLTPLEATVLAHELQAIGPNTLPVLAHEHGACVYLAPEGYCGIHVAKPNSCKNWHCSPGGTALTKDKGWLLSPAMKT